MPLTLIVIIIGQNEEDKAKHFPLGQSLWQHFRINSPNGQQSLRLQFLELLPSNWPSKLAINELHSHQCPNRWDFGFCI